MNDFDYVGLYIVCLQGAARWNRGRISLPHLFNNWVGILYMLALFGIILPVFLSAICCIRAPRRIFDRWNYSN